jgi:hypothetical protein
MSLAVGFAIAALMALHQLLPCGTCGLRYRLCACPNKRTDLH